MELTDQTSALGPIADDTIMKEVSMTCNDIDYTHPLDRNNILSHDAHGILSNSTSYMNDATWERINQIDGCGPFPVQLGDSGSGPDASKRYSLNKDTDEGKTNGNCAMIHNIGDKSTANRLPHGSSTRFVDIQTDAEETKLSRQTPEKERPSPLSSSRFSTVVKMEESTLTDDGNDPSSNSDSDAMVHDFEDDKALNGCQNCRESKMRAEVEDSTYSSLPQSIPQKEFARRGVHAAYSSRLNPYALHSGEFSLLRGQITRAQVTIYLNIRNAILQLWTRNPLLSVTPEEALGCAKESRHMELAKVAYLWLVRNGYVNFGCVESAIEILSLKHFNNKPSKQQTVVVVGAGMAGLGCARQLAGLFTFCAMRFALKDERPPRIIVIEGRNRIGGRIYSHPLRKQSSDGKLKEFRATAEMGAQIITGFENGNPLNAIVRGQLALPHHSIRDDSILFDYDGTHVDKNRDNLIEKLYNDILEKVSVYRHKSNQESTVEGERRHIDISKDPHNEDGPLIDILRTTDDVALKGLRLKNSDDAGTNETALASNTEADSLGPLHKDLSNTSTAQQRLDAARGLSISLDDIAGKPKVTLGKAMDEAVRQYQRNFGLSTQDLRLLNWHNANLEYANAANINQLSLGGWDQDIGNEFDGEHTEIIGGYLQVLRGLCKYPTDLDVRFKHKVNKVICRESHSLDQKPISVICSSGLSIAADKVIMTTPLGVLKAGGVNFEPSLPAWKNDCIQRIGFGLLNKVVLVYEEVFWEQDRDMFGLLNQSTIDESLTPEDYAAQRGRFYLFWNCTKMSGAPVLIALMAGDSAVDVEKADNEAIIKEITLKLQKMYPLAKVPRPSEAIVTKWQKDPMAKGSYSYVAPDTLPGDYGLMSQPVGPIHFAGEATCGSHPATVHGAYLSGLRAAGEVLHDMIGAIDVPCPLVRAKSNDCILGCESDVTSNIKKGKEELRSSKKEVYKAAMATAVEQALGRRPTKPARKAANPYLFFQKDYWFTCKVQCDEERRNATHNPQAKASRNTIRAALGRRWRSAPDVVKTPYLERAKGLKVNTVKELNAFKVRLLEWDRDADLIRETYTRQNPFEE